MKECTFHQSLSIPFEHPVTSLSISPTGNEAVLAAKRGLYIINLESLDDEAKMMQNMSKWDVADVQWNPHLSKSAWIASTSNQKALIWNIDLNNQGKPGSNVEFTISKHLRAVSDLNWSPFVPETLATCSYDAYVHLWDLRQGAQIPSHSFCGWTAGATQVKFNRINEWVLASSHDTDVRIWDIRNGSTPTKIITAHMTKIYGIDWSRNKQHEIVTCSQDKLVKFWDINQTRTPLATIETINPCWRARYTPFGNGVVTMPQRNDNNLYLWNRDNQFAPVYTFEGHTSTPTEFVWRYNRAFNYSNSSNQQLVTWSKDMHLRLWPIKGDILNLIMPAENDDVQRGSLIDMKPQHSEGYGLYSSNSESQVQNVGSLTSLARSISIPSVKSDTQLFVDEEEFDIEKELDAAAEQFPGVTIDKVHGKLMKSLINSRKCTIRIERSEKGPIGPSNANTVCFQVDVIFPKKYPAVPPFFEIQKSLMISMVNRRVLSRKLAQISAVFSSKKMACIDAALNYLLGSKPEKNMPPSSIVPASINADQNPVFDGSPDSIGYQLQTQITKPAIPMIDQDDPISDASSTDDENFTTMEGARVKSTSLSTLKDGQNVPYPKLCGANFSPNGKYCTYLGLLVYFFSPIPHPASTKFTAYTLTTRNQHPILQSQIFSTQPRSYAFYENYRSFLLSKFPRMFLGSVPNPIGERKYNHDENIQRDKKLDFWLDDDDYDEEVPSLMWTPKPASLTKQESYHTFDFLTRLSTAIIPPPSIESWRSTESRRQGINTKIDRGGKMIAKTLNRISSLPRNNNLKQNRRKSVSAMTSFASKEFDLEKKNNDDIHIGYWDRRKPELNSVESTSFNIEHHSIFDRQDGSVPIPIEQKLLPPALFQTDGSVELQQTKDLENSGVGTLIYTLSVDNILPVSSFLAKNYK
jgi:WD40 repeat protein